MRLKCVVVGMVLVGLGISTAQAKWTLLGLDADNGVTLQVTEVKVSPTNSNVIYAYTRPNGLYRSSNNGGSWELIYAVNDLNLGLQVISDNVAFINANGFQYTIDAGQTWNDVPVNIPDYVSVGDFYVDPGNVDDITIRVYTKPFIFNTKDGGTTWNPAIATVVDAIDAKKAWISMFQFTNSSYYLGVSTSTTNGAMTDSGLYYSTDKGQNWVKSIDSIGTVYALATAENNPDIAVAAGYGGTTEGTFITVDGGSHWTNLAAKLRYGPLVVRDNPTSSVPLIYSGAGLGNIVLRKAIGNCWRSMQDGLPTTVGFQEVSDIEIDPNDSSRLLLATMHGVFSQRDTGQFDATDCVTQFENEIPSASNSTTDTQDNTPTTPDSGGGGGGSLDVAGLLMLFGFWLSIRFRRLRS